MKVKAVEMAGAACTSEPWQLMAPCWRLQPSSAVQLWLLLGTFFGPTPPAVCCALELLIGCSISARLASHVHLCTVATLALGSCFWPSGHACVVGPM
jgi:hypothetical protein